MAAARFVRAAVSFCVDPVRGGAGDVREPSPRRAIRGRSGAERVPHGAFRMRGEPTGASGINDPVMSLRPVVGRRGPFAAPGPDAGPGAAIGASPGTIAACAAGTP